MPQGSQSASPHFLNPNQVQQVLGQQPQSLMAVETVTTHQGPIPSPEIIAGYEKVLAGSADRIIKMAEKEQAHRHAVQLKRQTQLGSLTLVGQIFAFLIGIVGVSGGVYLVKNDKSLVGFGVFFSSLATLAGIFFFGSKKPAQPNNQK